MRLNEERLREFERIYCEKIEESKPRYCPNCGYGEIDSVVLYDTKLKEIAVIYDCYCGRCGWSGDISPDDVANVDFQDV